MFQRGDAKAQRVFDGICFLTQSGGGRGVAAVLDRIDMMDRSFLTQRSKGAERQR